MRRELLLTLPLFLGAACSTVESEDVVANAVSTPEQCDNHLIEVYVGRLGQIQLNKEPSDLDGIREAARRKALACRSVPASVEVLTDGPPNDTTRAVVGIVSDEIESLDLSSSFFLHSHSRASSDGPDELTCENMSLDIVVTDDGELRLNGHPSILEALEAHVEIMAVACEGVTPTGTYEGPSHVTVIASMIWPILQEELPDLELEERIRRPGGRGYDEG